VGVPPGEATRRATDFIFFAKLAKPAPAKKKQKSIKPAVISLLKANHRVWRSFCLEFN